MAKERAIAAVYHADAVHWVGDGFRVHNFFPSGNNLGDKLSPFILMDYHPPYDYTPTTAARGVGVHPHRGFETVTMAFAGSVEHHDSAGGGGVIGPGDVQWMTAGAGVLHKEHHEKAFARRGGTMHMMQLWVDLPRAHKMDAPRYQALLAGEMGKVELPDDGGTVNVIAGEYRGAKGPAKTFSPINLWDIRFTARGRMAMSFPARENTALIVLDGAVTINGTTKAGARELVLFANAGEDIAVEAAGAAQLLLLNGEPLHQPVVQYGPFVMNTVEEIQQAIDDFNRGKFGHLE